MILFTVTGKHYRNMILFTQSFNMSLYMIKRPHRKVNERACKLKQTLEFFLNNVG